MQSPLEILSEIPSGSQPTHDHHIHNLPILIMMPHSSCNCRCVMCDIWKANQNSQELSEADLLPHLEGIKKLNTQQVVFSGGEALMHKNLWVLSKLLKQSNPTLKITLLTTGLLIKKNAHEILDHCHEVIISLDGSPEVHNRIRNIPRAFEKLSEGVATLRKLRPDFRITARCVVQRENFREIPEIIKTAKDLDLNQISFLAADLSTTAFNRLQPWDDKHNQEIAPGPEESNELEEIIDRIVDKHSQDFAENFIAEKPEKFRRIAQYYQAMHGIKPFPEVKCNAPWVSAVIESNGDIQPCFFHPKFGNIRQGSFDQLVNSSEAKKFRMTLDVASNPVCQKCVCTLNLKSFSSV